MMISFINISAILVFLLSVSPISSQESTGIAFQCQNETGTYAPNSIYRSNLNTLLSYLSSNSSDPRGFYNVAISPNSPDVVYGLFLCRGDVSTVVCRDCVTTASKEILEKCLNEKAATVWYDECLLRYSNQYIFSSPGYDHRSSVVLRNTQQISKEANQFKLAVQGLMQRLTAQAMHAESGKMFATGEVNLTAFMTLYGMQQCIPDISIATCNACLNGAILETETCCNQSQGVRVLFTSCSVRYELYPFYNMSVMSPLAPSPPLALSPPAPANSTSGHGKGGGKVKIIAISAGVSVFAVLTLLGSIYYQQRWKKKQKGEEGISQEVQLFDFPGERFADDYSSENFQGDDTKSQDFPSIKFDFILKATKHFSEENKLGEGGFGPVYRGTLPDGKEIAVKRLSRTSGQGLQEFKNEVTLIARLQHRNLVRLLGCCLEENESLLIYEYMPNKSLDVFLFDSNRGTKLNWKTRLSIINGVARGILYLHEDSRLRIIHRDLKASNILLDLDLNPKISDFGMARIFGGNQSQANTNRVVGTYGYMAPEYAMEGLFSVKSDVFSFGVLLLEIVTGKRNGGFYLSEHGQSLLTFAWKLWSEGKGLELIDLSMQESCVAAEALKCIHIALLCVQEDPADRPTMSSVVVMLVSDNVMLPQPRQPAFSVGRLVLRSTQSSSNVKAISVNEVTLTESAPR